MFRQNCSSNKIAYCYKIIQKETTNCAFFSTARKFDFDAVSSSGTDAKETKNPLYKPNKTKNRLGQSFKLAKILTQKVREVLAFKPGNVPPTNLGFVDKKGGALQLDVDIPLKVVFEDASVVLQQETKKLATHFRQRFYLIDHPNLLRNIKDTVHTETFIQYEFRTEEDMKNWQTGSDSDWSEGYSKCEFYQTDRGTAIFEGILSKRLVKDGRTERAGWCSIKTIDRMSFLLKKRYDEWGYYSHLLIKCRGDGRSYKVMLHNPEYWDVTWGDSYSFPLHTHGGPYWQYEMIPFSKFFYTVGGRIMDRQRKMIQEMTNSIGIVIMDRIEGPFRLEIDFIGVTHNKYHTERSAYEKYNTPLAHPYG